MKQTIAIIILALVSICTNVGILIRDRQTRDTFTEVYQILSDRKPEIIEKTVRETPVVEQVNMTMPDGHWESYCIYPENENGYRTRGAMIRVSGGDCKNNWRVVEVWER